MEGEGGENDMPGNTYEHHSHYAQSSPELARQPSASSRLDSIINLYAYTTFSSSKAMIIHLL